MSGCWLWTGCGNSSGYGQKNISPGRKVVAHRLVFELLVAPVPLGMQLDHRCRVRCCVNPAHLQVVTQRENLVRGDGWAGQNHRKTHCPVGHRLSGANVYAPPGAPTQRHCRTCRRIRNRAQHRANGIQVGRKAVR